MNKTQVKILEKKRKPFKGVSGDMVDYYWYKCIRLDDDVSFQFGSVRGVYEVGTVQNLELEKVFFGNGKQGWKEVTFVDGE